MRTVVLVLLLSGCAITGTDWSERSPAEVAAAVDVQYDPRFDEWPQFVGPLSRNGDGAALIRSWGHGNPAEMIHQVYVTASSPEWRFLQGLDVEGGETYAFKRIDSDVGSCSVYGCSTRESVGAVVKWEYLESRQNKGFSVRAVSQQGNDVVVFVGPSYIQGYLQAVWGYEGDVKSATDNGSRSGDG